MVTANEGYWDNIERMGDKTNKAYFTKNKFYTHVKTESLLKKDLLYTPPKDNYIVLNEAPTIFIKITESKPYTIEKIWGGKVEDFCPPDENGRIWFTVTIKATLDKNKWSKIDINEKMGCFVIEDNSQTSKVISAAPKTQMNIPVTPIGATKQPSKISNPQLVEKTKTDNKKTSLFKPPFLYLLETTTNSEIFENYVHNLIKLLGIHQAGKFPPKDQFRQMDGFFKSRTLAVAWDATLHEEFKERKKGQIENYCEKLLEAKITLPKIGTLTFAECDKEVWIITREAGSKLIKIIDSIYIKEVSIIDLIELYETRLEQDFDETMLVNKLRNIGL
jgi:hypothetical protein